MLAAEKRHVVVAGMDQNKYTCNIQLNCINKLKMNNTIFFRLKLLFLENDIEV